VTWRNGAESVIDVSRHLADYTVLRPLCADDMLFRAVQVGEFGWCVHWPNSSGLDNSGPGGSGSDDLEVSADTLWRLALEQGGAWLKSWRTAHGMTQAEAATALGVSPRMWRYYEAGSHLLPKTVRLACLGLDAQAEAA
jgi:hypothetical protein